MNETADPTADPNTNAFGSAGTGTARIEASRLLITPEEAARALSVGRTTIYALLRTGAVESVRIGSSRRVPIGALHRYVDELRSGTSRC